MVIMVCLAAGLLGVALQAALYGGVLPLELSLAWGFATANAAAAVGLGRRAVGGDLLGFLVFGVLGNLARALVLLLAVVGLLFVPGLTWGAFAAALAPAYLAGMGADVWTLHRASFTREAVA